MTRADARIAVRLVGVLVIGLSIGALLVSLVVAVDRAVRLALLPPAFSEDLQSWSQVIGNVGRVCVWLAMMVLGVWLLVRGERAAEWLYKGVEE